MGIIEEETKILEYLLDECMFVCAGLDYDDLQFSIRVVHKASCMGGIFSIYRGDYTGDEKNIIGVSVPVGTRYPGYAVLWNCTGNVLFERNRKLLYSR